MEDKKDNYHDYQKDQERSLNFRIDLIQPKIQQDKISIFHIDVVLID